MQSTTSSFYRLPAPEFKHDASADPVGRRPPTGHRHEGIKDQGRTLDAAYAFLSEFADAWRTIVGDLLAMQTVDQAALAAVFLADRRKLHVGVFMVLLSLLYLFVFINA